MLTAQQPCAIKAYSVQRKATQDNASCAGGSTRASPAEINPEQQYLIFASSLPFSKSSIGPGYCGIPFAAMIMQNHPMDFQNNYRSWQQIKVAAPNGLASLKAAPTGVSEAPSRPPNPRALLSNDVGSPPSDGFPWKVPPVQCRPSMINDFMQKNAVYKQPATAGWSSELLSYRRIDSNVPVVHLNTDDTGKLKKQQDALCILLLQTVDLIKSKGNLQSKIDLQTPMPENQLLLHVQAATESAENVLSQLPPSIGTIKPDKPAIMRIGTGQTAASTSQENVPPSSDNQVALVSPCVNMNLKMTSDHMISSHGHDLRPMHQNMLQSNFAMPVHMVSTDASGPVNSMPFQFQNHQSHSQKVIDPMYEMQDPLMYAPNMADYHTNSMNMSMMNPGEGMLPDYYNTAPYGYYPSLPYGMSHPYHIQYNRYADSRRKPTDCYGDRGKKGPIVGDRALTPPAQGWYAKYSSGVTGVVWDRVHQAWVVSWTLAGKRTFRHFTCKSYGGFDKAREAAIEFRLARNKEIAAYNKRNKNK